MRSTDHRRMAIGLLAAHALALVVFQTWPAVDLSVSGWFFDPEAGFRLARKPWLEGARMLVWRLSTAMVVLALAGLALALAGRRLAGIGARLWGFIVLLYLLGPILLVNGILKRFWGRARPADIAEFGGTAHFTPPWPPADECVRNCSFVSGEGAGAMALMISALLVLAALRPRLTPAVHRLGAVLAVALPAAGIGLRIATGRHFLSDMVFAALFVLAIALMLDRFLPDRRKGG